MSKVKVKINLDSRISFDGQFRRQLKTLLAIGEATPGNRLPTVRELSVELGINANYLKRLLASLAEDGILAWREGVGAFAVDLAKDGGVAEYVGDNA
jgi:GntR family transcriptional regulator